MKLYIISFYARRIFREIKGCSGTRKMKIWLGTPVSMTPKSTVFPPCHSATQAFLNYNFWGVMETWYEICSLGGTKKAIHYFE